MIIAVDQQVMFFLKNSDAEIRFFFVITFYNFILEIAKQINMIETYNLIAGAVTAIISLGILVVIVWPDEGEMN